MTFERPTHLQEPNQLGISLILRGDVQGSGVRPTIVRLARAVDLSGYVRNSFDGVEISLFGTLESIEQFQLTLQGKVPAAVICRNLISAASGESWRGFDIIPSHTEGATRCVIPLDRVTCSTCITEAMTPGDRRFGYALNSCCECGPRYTILHDMPFDRCRTSFAEFPMCSDCLCEYNDHMHRRFHAQTNCCPRCGPQIYYSSPTVARVAGNAGLEHCAQAIGNGKIVAIKGVGGYQLVCDGSDEVCVSLLRKRKGRLFKPLAIMVASLEAAREIVQLNALEEAALKSSVGPIVVAQAKPSTTLAPSVHPGLNQIGVMLPTMVLHALLLQHFRGPLVVTSGNVEGDPLEFDAVAAEQRLADIADSFLHHNRPIVNPIDDSVVRCMAGRQVTMRAARGLAPMSIALNDSASSILAVGGQQKSAIALSNGHISYLGPHVGELQSLQVRERYRNQHASLARLTRTQPSVIVCDRHPDYYSTEYARNMNANDACYVQHHHAHIVAGMAEHGWLDREVLGFAFDGTGLGSDDTVWGGEVLLATTGRFTRVAHLRPFRLIGGDSAIREPWRVATALLTEIGCDAGQIAAWLNQPLNNVRILQQILVEPSTSLAPTTTSMGRLFDGIAALVCRITHSTYEGEAAMRLEAACDNCQAGHYEIIVTNERPREIDWRRALMAIVEDLRQGVARSTIATRFHRAIAECVNCISLEYPEHSIVFSGGVFQNRFLVDLLAGRWPHVRTHALGFPGRIPPNDGGLAIGQLCVAQALTEKSSCV